LPTQAREPRHRDTPSDAGPHSESNVRYNELPKRPFIARLRGGKQGTLVSAAPC
jgi:hypothetical protein